MLFIKNRVDLFNRPVPDRRIKLILKLAPSWGTSLV
jgi:hypothetical protein